MAFWILTLLPNLILPVIMIIIGVAWVKRPPKEINYIYGYRTTLSMKNNQTWAFAHKYCGRLWKTYGIITFFLSVAVALLVFNQSKDIIGFSVLILMFTQITLLVVSIVLVQKALRKHFDENGNAIDEKQ